MVICRGRQNQFSCLYTVSSYNSGWWIVSSWPRLNGSMIFCFWWIVIEHVSGTIRKSILKSTCHSTYPENPCKPSHSTNFHSMIRQLRASEKQLDTPNRSADWIPRWKSFGRFVYGFHAVVFLSHFKKALIGEIAELEPCGESWAFQNVWSWQRLEALFCKCVHGWKTAGALLSLQQDSVIHVVALTEAYTDRSINNRSDINIHPFAAWTQLELHRKLVYWYYVLSVVSKLQKPMYVYLFIAICYNAISHHIQLLYYMFVLNMCVCHRKKKKLASLVRWAAHEDPKLAKTLLCDSGVLYGVFVCFQIFVVIWRRKPWSWGVVDVELMLKMKFCKKK